MDRGAITRSRTEKLPLSFSERDAVISLDISRAPAKKIESATGRFYFLAEPVGATLDLLAKLVKIVVRVAQLNKISSLILSASGNREQSDRLTRIRVIQNNVGYIFGGLSS